MSEKLQQDHYEVTPKNHLPENSGDISSGEGTSYLAGRGAQFNTKNRFLKDNLAIL